MNNIPISQVMEFFYNIFSQFFYLIRYRALVKWFVLIPVASLFLYLIFNLIFDVSHVLDDYKSKHQKYYKGNKNKGYNNRKFKNQKPIKYGEFNKYPQKNYKANNKPNYSKAPRSSAKFDKQFDIKYED